MSKNLIIVHPSQASAAQSELCARKATDIVFTDGYEKTIGDQVFTVLNFDCTRRGRRRSLFGLCSKKVSYTRLKGTKMPELVWYEDGVDSDGSHIALGVVDPAKGVIYNRLLLQPTEEDIALYEERVAHRAQQEARRAAWNERKAAPIVIPTITEW